MNVNVHIPSAMVSEESLMKEARSISDVTGIPYYSVLYVIKGIDAYCYLMGLQDVLTFDDEYRQFIDSTIQPREYDPNCVIDDNEMFDFISSHTDIPDEIIERIMMEDCRYQHLI